MGTGASNGRARTEGVHVACVLRVTWPKPPPAPGPAASVLAPDGADPTTSNALAAREPRRPRPTYREPDHQAWLRDDDGRDTLVAQGI